MSYRVRGSVQFFPVGVGLAVALSLLYLLIPANMVGQDASSPAKAADAVDTTEAGQNAAIRVTVLADNGKPLDRQAVVKLVNEVHQTANWQTTGNRSETVFGDLSFGKYDIEVSAFGYITSHKQAEVVNLVDTVPVEIVLQRDPAAAEQNITAASMSPKGNLEMERAIKALNSGELKEAQKHLEEADKSSPSSAQLKFLFGYLYFQKGDFPQAGQYLVEATTLNPHYGHALTLLGRVRLLRGQYVEAKAALEEAVAADPNNWVSHDLLADVHLQQHDYEKAREQAQLAIAKSRKNGVVAQLALGEALANLGKTQDAIQALKAFLESQSRSAAAPHAQQLLELLEQGQAKDGGASAAKLAEVASFAVATDVLPSAYSSLPEMTWQPPGIDEEPPPVAAGVSCPYEKVIAGAGEGVEQLVADVARFAAIEELVHEKLDEMGNPTARETRKFDYAASAYQTQPDVVQVDEYRTERYGLNDLPDHIADNGFAALALVFHPAMRDSFQMTCEGLGDWHGQPTWLVRFQQREDRPNHLQAYLLGSARFAVSLKGRAWITAGRFQIVRIETEMVKPMPQIQLVVEHQITEYGPVPFQKKNVELWLPKTAEVYMNFRGHRYYRKHTFEKYMLFSVEEQQKVHEAKHDPTRPASSNPGKGSPSTS